MEIMEKGEVKKNNPKISNKSSGAGGGGGGGTPRISIYVDNGQENIEFDESAATNKINDDDNNMMKSEENLSTKMMKCHSMQNMRLATTTTTTSMENDRYKQNLNQFNSNYYYQAANQMIPIKTDAIRLKHGAAYRKCLSRVNLNLYQNNNSNICSPSNMVHSSSQQEHDDVSQNNTAARVLINPKLVKITPNRYSKVRSSAINAVSIMNLENCVDNLGLESESSLNKFDKQRAYSSRRNLLMNKSYSNLSNNQLKASTAQLIPTTNMTGGGILITSSSSNLLKSSNSLNALIDLDMMESVSVGSFDRLSLYSCGACNSDSDLRRSFYLVDGNYQTSESRLNLPATEMITSTTSSPPPPPAPNTNTTTNKKRTSNGFSLIDPTLSLSNLKETRVIDWLEHI